MLRMRLDGACAALAACLSVLTSPAYAVPPNPRVGIMPGYPNAPYCDVSKRRPCRPGVPVIIFGNANGGDGTAIGNPYVFSFSANPNVSVTPVNPPLNGVITDDHYIFEEVKFTLLGGSTKENITATLKVTFPGPVVKQISVDLVIIDPSDPSSNTPLSNLGINVSISIQDGLRALYLMQNTTNGSWPSVSLGAQETCAATAFALWAFENQGHVPSNPQLQDIYSEFVERGLEFIFQGAVATGTGATRADVPRGAVANGVSDLNSNGRGINLCPGGLSAWYPPPLAVAAVIASLDPARTVATGPFAGTTYKIILEDAVDWIGTVQNSAPINGPRGGWFYTGPSAASDMSISSWYYLALEGIQAVLPPCTTGGGGGGITVPDWIKQEAEYALIYHQTNAAGAQAFGYNSNFPLQGATHGIATTSGGLSGLALVQSETPTLPVGAILAAEPAPLNTITAKRNAALSYLGANWNETTNSQFLGFANRGNWYAMWTTARALRITAKALSLPAGQKVILTHGGVDFDWETGETFIAGIGQTNVPAPGNPREGYFPFVVRKQDTSSGPTTRGQWSQGTYLTNQAVSMETSLSILILTNRVFGPECQISCKDIVVPCDDPKGAVVHYDPQITGCAQGTQIICSPPSGSVFPIGVTNVICYAEEPCSKRRSLPCCFTVTVTECPCLTVKDKRVDCSSQKSGDYLYTFDVTNLTGKPVKRIRLLPCDMNGDLLPDFTMTPDTFNFATPLANGASTSITVTISGADPSKPACFEIWMFDEKLQNCCKVKHCVDLPQCCFTLVESKASCDPVNPGQYSYSFVLKNLAPYAIDRLFLWPNGGFNMTPSSFFLAPVATGQMTPVLNVTITGAAPGSTICFDISIHKAATGECCLSTVCLTLPDCNPCMVEDRCELTPAIKLCREGDLLRGVIKLTICSYCSDQPAAFKFSLDGATDAMCPVKYLNPPNFSPSSGTTAPIPRGQCVTIPITISVPIAQFPLGKIGCFQATVTNTLTGDTFSCKGKAKAPNPNDPIKVVVGSDDPVGVPVGTTRPVVFHVTNLTTAVQQFRFQISSSEPGLTDSGALSLNGLPPGTPVRSTISLAAGASQDVSVEVSFRIHSPLGMLNVFLVSVDSAQNAETVAAAGVQSVLQVDCNKNGVPDDVDIEVGNSHDANSNGVPDDCEGLPLLPAQTFRRGDSNADGAIDVSDAVAVLDFLFSGRSTLGCLDAADVDDQGSVDISDAVAMLGYLFLGGREPAAPGPLECGVDPTADALPCNDHAACN